MTTRSTTTAIHACECAVCESEFVPREEMPRLKVRDFQFCLCSNDCAGRLLADPDRYVEARREILLIDPSELAKCPFGAGPCPYVNCNSE